MRPSSPTQASPLRHRPSKRGAVVLTTSYPSRSDDSAGHFVRAEVRRQLSHGQEVSVIAAGGKVQADGEATQAAWDPAPVHWLGGQKLFSLPGVLPRLREHPLRILQLAPVALRLIWLSATFPSLSSVTAHWLLPCGWPAALLFHTDQLEIVVHGSDLKLFARLPARIRRFIMTSLAQRRAQLRFVSSALRAELCTLGPWSPAATEMLKRSRVEPAALEVPDDLNQEKARQLLGLEPNERWLVIVARLFPEKRVEEVLIGAELVPNARIAVIGDGPQKDELTRKAPQARFLGQLPRNEALIWIAAADALLHGSLAEGASSVIREARLLGTPVVAAPSGDVEAWAQRDPHLWVLGRSHFYSSLKRGSSWAKLHGLVRTSSCGRRILSMAS